MARFKPDKPDPDWEQRKERLLARLRGAMIVGISGKIGDVVFRTRGRKISAARLPKPRSKPPTPEQAAQMGKFSRAAAQAEELLADPVQQACHQELSARKKEPARNILMGELLRGEAPRVLERAVASTLTGRCAPRPELVHS